MKPLSAYLHREYSQHNEDGMLLAVFETIGVRDARCVEVGTGDGRECNTRLLREQRGWNGLLLDATHEDWRINLHKELVTASNIDTVFRRYGIPEEFDLLSIDVDGQDWHLWNGLTHRPRVVIIEYACSFGPSADLVMPLDPFYRWNGELCGATLSAMAKLANRKGYALVGGNVVNCIFVREESLPERAFVHQGDAEAILKYAAHHCRYLPHPLASVVSWNLIQSLERSRVREAIERGWRPSSTFLSSGDGY
jgi:hypothetical protein